MNKKLERWAEQLLDTGKRNNLINFHDTKASTLEVVFPDARDLFEKVGSASSFEIFDPKISETEDDYEDPEEASEDKERFSREEYIDKYSGHLRKNQLLVYSIGENPIAAVKNIHKKAGSFIEETGVNVAYLVFGFIHWKEHENSDTEFRAPVLLVPVTFENDSAIRPYFVKMAEEEIVVNPTFSYKTLADRNIKLPEYQEDEPLDDYLDQVEEAVQKLGWTVTRECKIGIFSFLKINMYRDLLDNEKKILENNNVRILLGEADSDLSEGTPADADENTVRNELVDLHAVVDADSSQIDAIQMAKSGKSFVLQGPPGTGKSQTITNLIAECLSDGKKVLFVSEKMAALNVVYDKLKKAGLEEFCLELHSHKTNKKDVIAELCRTLILDKTTVSPRADNEIQAKERAQKQLDEYEKALHKIEPVVELSPYQLYSACSHFKDVPDIRYSIPAINTKSQDALVEDCLSLEEYTGFIPTIGEDFHNNCFYGFTGDQTFDGILKTQDGLHASAEAARQILTCIDDLDTFGIKNLSFAEIRILPEAISLLEASRTVTPGLLDKDCYNAFKAKIAGAAEAAINCLTSKELLQSKFNENIFNLHGSDAVKLLTEKYSGFFSRLFSSEYKKLAESFTSCLRAREKSGYATLLKSAKLLSDYQENAKKYADAEPVVKTCVGADFKGLSSDWNRINQDLQELGRLYNLGISFKQLSVLSMENFEAGRQELVNVLKDLRDLLGTYGSAIEEISSNFDKAVFDIKNAEFSSVVCRLGACDNSSGNLDNWYRFKALLSKLEKQGLLPYIAYIIEAGISADKIVDSYKKAYYRQWISYIFQQRNALNSFSRLSQDQAVQTFGAKDKLQFEINKLKIKSTLSRKRPALDMVAAGSPIMTLQREGQKKRKQKNIRTLFAETGDLVQLLKPCFLMSPLSVSTYLSTGNITFDTVIFDEASQIFPQDAIGATYRGKQLIVVGDSRQMPPSNFFNAATEIEEPEEEVGDVTDFESILDLCAGCMPQLRLNWHYRSRFEQLISFSNKNFYENSLVTFPSSKEDGKWTGVDYYHVDGLFDRKSKTNRKEAEFIVDLIYENIEKFPDRSLGVVAFSVSQQELIDKLLSRRRQEDPSREEFFRSTAEGSFFIKNLETVQGDERDTIIFSVAYGKDPQGRLLMNFGPLNRAGGERRLNVAVTRARTNIQLVSSMRATDIDLSRTESTGARLLREYLDYAEHGRIALERTFEVSPFVRFDSDFEAEVHDFLTENGYSADTQVGCSSFRIDLGLKRPGTSEYVLAIECDGAAYHASKNARDRDRLRQQILERMGWKFYRIWSTDWFKNKKIEKERLLEACKKALNSPVAENTSNDIREQQRNEEIASDFETVDSAPMFSFPEYHTVNAFQYMNATRDFVKGIRNIMEYEAPLSEEWLLQRIASVFGRTKVTSVVREEYEKRMRYMARYGILRKDHFLYLSDKKDYVLRIPGDLREIRDIALEELAAGMVEIICLNISITKEALFQTLGKALGVSRIGDAINQRFNEAFRFIENQLTVSGELISLKDPESLPVR